MLIIRILTFLFAVLMVSQALLINNATKGFISRADKLEGKSVAESQLIINKGEVEICIENHSTLRPLIFFINGDAIVTPRGKSIKIEVKNGDIVEVSGAGLSDTAILKVTSASDNIVVPEPGKIIYVSNNLAMIDRIRLKQ